MRYIRHQSVIVIDACMHIALAFRSAFCTPFCRRNACQSFRQPPSHLLVNGEWMFDSESYGPIKFRLHVHQLLTDILCTWPADIYRKCLLFTACCGSTCARTIFPHFAKIPTCASSLALYQYRTSKRNDVFFADIYAHEIFRSLRFFNFQQQVSQRASSKNQLVYINFKKTKWIFQYFGLFREKLIVIR